MRKLIRYARRVKRSVTSTKAPQDPALRLHLGCGDDYWPGYINIDQNSDSECDVCLDFTRVGELYQPGSISEVAMIHSLAYLRLWQARDLMSVIHGLLTTGGRLIIETPDLEKCALQITRTNGKMEDYLEAVRALYAFDLEQIRNREPYPPYAFGWSGWHLKQELEIIGFRQVVLCSPQTHGAREWRDTRFEAIK